jgi:hypothetical protein
MITSGVRDVVQPPSLPPFPGGQKHPRQKKMHTHLRNMPHGIAGETPTSLVLTRDNVQSLKLKA